MYTASTCMCIHTPVACEHLTQCLAGEREQAPVTICIPSPLGAHGKHRQEENSRIRGSIMNDSKNSRRTEKREATLGWLGPGKFHGSDQIRPELQRLGWTLDMQEKQRQHMGKRAWEQRQNGKEQGPTGDQAVDQFIMDWGTSEWSWAQAGENRRPRLLPVTSEPSHAWDSWKARSWGSLNISSHLYWQRTLWEWVLCHLLCL